ncbi:MAG TPA: serine hydrolase domain-containing protein, partial [Caulobacteraceae bacterium]|nr:serine hydrolase domain-containing protein [Caulobacteraceae bacterium]
SLAILMQMEEGRLAIDEPVTRWLPEFAGMRVLNDPAGPLSDTRPAAREVTVEDLLTHRSGVGAGFTDVGPIAEARNARLGSPLANPLTPDEWLKAVGELPLTYAPGERFHYGDSTDVLGFLAARIDGRPLGELLRRRIFQPLGMADTGFWVPPEKRGRMAHMYLRPDDGGPLRDVSYPLGDQPPAFESGGGGLISSAEDYLKFARLLLGGGAADGVRLVRPETVALMTADRLTAAQRGIPAFGLPWWWSGQGFGLGVSTVTDAQKYEIDGAGSVGAFGWPGAFGTWWMADPAQDLVWIYLVQDAVPLGQASLGQLVSGERLGARRSRRTFQKMVYGALEP